MWGVVACAVANAYAGQQQYKARQIADGAPLHRPARQEPARLDVVADARMVRRSAMLGFALLAALVGTLAYGAAQLLGVV